MDWLDQHLASMAKGYAEMARLPGALPYVREYVKACRDKNPELYADLPQMVADLLHSRSPGPQPSTPTIGTSTEKPSSAATAGPTAKP